jgi:dolichyl-diphosphooligosaccharide--protein glycosyltransferase
MAESEDTANGIADTIGIRYIITDIEMDEAIQGKFWAMATWYNTTQGAQPYVTTYAVPSQNDPTKYTPAPLINQHYYETMISRLHNFDGSLTNASTVYYIEYVDPSVSSVSFPLITNAREMNAAEAHVKADQYNAKATQGYHAAVLSPSIVVPTDTVPALLHYRLVHESPTNVYGTKTPDVKYVKVFEYVKGAHIKGTGVIEIPLISNTGRKFTYRQQSINGEFIVPYSTSGNPYDVKALGKYRISGMTKEFEVPENALMQGLTIK